MTDTNTTNTAARDQTPESSTAFRYTAQLADQIETRWQREWERRDTFRVPNPGDDGFDPTRPKFFCLDMFPYPSGAGLHVGHPEGYTATDIVCRYKRHQGFNVLHPMGWDAFGLPAEQYAITTGVHPALTTRKAIDAFRRQLQRFGFCYDWDREYATIDQEYYRWTQWIWLQAYHAWYDAKEDRARPINELADGFASGARTVCYDPHAPAGLVMPDYVAGDLGAWNDLDPRTRKRVLDSYRLAYISEQTVNWCPKLGTALANEEVIDGRSERGGFPVFRKPLRQWMFRITAFAERLLADLEGLAWPDSTRTMQKAWIGRSEGAELQFPIVEPPDGTSGAICVFTTRPDTLFGATYMVLAPEHPLVETMLAHPKPATDAAAFAAYIEEARNRTDIDRMAESLEKTGVFTGYHAINPATGDAIPVWVADYVLMGYGHGAIMAVPAHDERDYQFAKTFSLPIVDVVHNVMHRALHACCSRLVAEGRTTGNLLPWIADFVGLCVHKMRDDHEAVWAIVSERHDPARATAGRTDIACQEWIETLTPWIEKGQTQFIEAAASYRLADFLGSASAEHGLGVNSANDDVSLNGLATDEATRVIIDWLERKGIGRRKVNFKLRDWLFSRQRYWGEPFPIVHDEHGDHYPVSAASLPVILPEMEDYQPLESDTPVPLLAKATEWVNTTAAEAGVNADDLPGDTKVMRETNTMPGWAGSCWYYLRYCDPRNGGRFVSREAEEYWMVSPKKDGSGDMHRGGVDLYIGGAEHAVLHLLYARFWHKLLYDLGEVSTPEPFGRLFHQGLITAYAYQRADKSLVPIDEVEEPKEGAFIETATGTPVQQVAAKMSKSLKNVVNPDDVIADYGADTFRLYEMYMGPLEATKPWNTRDIVGSYRFLQRVWRLVVDETTGTLVLRDDADAAVEKRLHATIAKVGPDIERLAMNTAIAAMIEFTNEATRSGGLTADQLERFAITLSPFAPHMAEELWSMLGHDDLIVDQPWPTVDEALLHEDEIELPVQILGKVRSRITVPADADADAVEQAALSDERIKELLEGKTVRKVIVQLGRIVNIVAS